MNDRRRDLVQHWIDRSHEVIEEAHLMANAGHWNTCVNRLYYACFYAVTALLLEDGLSSAKHSGVRSLFNRHFVKAGTVPRDLARLYNDLFDNRQQGDYVGFVVFEEEQVRPWIMQAEELVRHIEKLLSTRRQAPDT